MIYYIVGSMLFVAAVTDILWRKIPNIIIFIYSNGIPFLFQNFQIYFFGGVFK